MHKLSKKLFEEYDAVTVEDLNMKGRNQTLNTIMERGMFLRMLEYKLIFLRKQSLKINRQVS